MTNEDLTSVGKVVRRERLTIKIMVGVIVRNIFEEGGWNWAKITV